MTFEDQLKKEIISQYGSVRAFSTALGMTNSTLDSMLTRGIYNSGVGKVMKIFERLGIDPESLSVGRIIYTWEKEKKSPAPDGPERGDKLTKYDVEGILISLGLINDGEHISDRDLTFVNDVVSILDAWFQEKREGS